MRKTKNLVINGIQELIEMKEDVGFAPASEGERIFKHMAENFKLVVEVDQVSGHIRIISVDAEGGPRG